MTEKLSTRNHVQIAKKLLARESFNTNGELKGVAKPSWVDFGRMHVWDNALLYSDQNSYGVDYVIYSYSTPIAWLRGDGQWAMPQAKYSVITTRHQTTIRAAIQEYKKALNNAKDGE